VIDLIAMRPSEWKDMPDRLSSESFRVELGNALSRFLRSSRNDGGSGADEIYMTGVRLTQAGVWNYFSAKQAADLLKLADTGVSSAFLDATPDDIRLDIQEELNSLEPRRAKRRGRITGRFGVELKRLTGRSLVKQGTKPKRAKKA